MPLISLISILIVVGVVLYLINNYIPMDSKIKSIINAIVVIVLVLWVLRVFGVLDTLTYLRVGKP